METQEYPLTSERFVVSIASNMIGFSKVSGIKLKSQEIQVKNEGGSDIPLFLPEQRKNLNTLTLEKGVLWSEKKKDGQKDLISLAGKSLWDLIIMVYGKDRNVKRAYCADYALVKEITLSDLNAASPNTLIESMIIVYDLLRPLDNKKMEGMSPIPTADMDFSSTMVSQGNNKKEQIALDSELSDAIGKNEQIHKKQSEQRAVKQKQSEQKRKQKEDRVEF